MRKSLTSIIVFVIFFCAHEFINAQSMGFVFPDGKHKKVIPFKKYNNLIIISIRINDAITVDFILDTSIEHTIVTEKSIGDEAKMNYLKKITMGGTKKNPINAYIANNVKLELPGGIVSQFGQLVLVMEKDYFNFRK